MAGRPGLQQAAVSELSGAAAHAWVQTSLQPACCLDLPRSRAERREHARFFVASACPPPEAQLLCPAGFLGSALSADLALLCLASRCCLQRTTAAPRWHATPGGCLKPSSSSLGPAAAAAATQRARLAAATTPSGRAAAAFMPTSKRGCTPRPNLWWSRSRRAATTTGQGGTSTCGSWCRRTASRASRWAGRPLPCAGPSTPFLAARRTSPSCMCRGCWLAGPGGKGAALTLRAV